jgi:SAM-dependent methyltransferase
LSLTEDSAALTLTGERTLPGIWHENYWFRRHEVTYLFAAGQLGQPDQAVVLEAGSGEGYGTEILAGAGSGPSRTVIAVDYDQATTAHLARRYPRTRVVRGNLVALPLASGSVDAVVSLQTVEHLWDQPGFAAECGRVLRPGGVLVVSTPNRLTFSPGLGRGERPANPFHVNELDAAELVALLAAVCPDLQLFGVHPGRRIAAYEVERGPVVPVLAAAEHASWPDHLASFVRSVRADDFEVAADGAANPVDEALDLVAVGRTR